MNLSKNKKTKMAAWAFFLGLTALICSNAGAQSSLLTSLNSVDLIDSDTAHDEENEIIHYVFVMDDNLGILNSATTDVQKRQLIKFSEKIKSENPYALISVIRNTDVLDTHDMFLQEMNALNYENQKLDIEAEINERKKAFAEELSEKEKEYIEEKINWLNTKLATIELQKKIEHASRTIIFIMAHGGGHRYRAGDFKVERSNLAKRKGIEFILLTCMAGNLDLSNTPNIKVFGTGSEHTLSSGIHLTAFLGYLNTNAISPPTSALEFYEAYETSYNQTPVMIPFIMYFIECIPPSYVSETIVQNAYNALATYYIDSFPAKIFETLTAWTPSPSNPWFSDPEKQDYRGTKENAWWSLVSTQEDVYLNNALPLIGLVLAISFQLGVTEELLQQTLQQIEMRYL